MVVQWGEERGKMMVKRWVQKMGKKWVSMGKKWV